MITLTKEEKKIIINGLEALKDELENSLFHLPIILEKEKAKKPLLLTKKKIREIGKLRGKLEQESEVKTWK